MKRIIIASALLSVGLISCNRDLNEDVVSNDANRLSTVSGSDLEAELTEMNETFVIAGKTSSLSYSYKAYAEPPIINSIRTNATSVSAVGDMVFVTWHTVAAPFGGAISAYKLNTATGKYVYTARVDFVDTDFHEAVAVDNPTNNTYEVFAVGQRDQDQSGYLLNGHEGAIIGRVTYDKVNDLFNTGNYKELPLPSYGANGIITSAGKYYVVTGNGNGGDPTFQRGGLYVTDYNLTNVSEAADLVDGEFIVANQFTASTTDLDYSVLDRNDGDKVAVYYQKNTASSVNNSYLGTADAVQTGLSDMDVERQGMSYLNDSTVLFALGQNGLYSYDPTNSFQLRANLGSALAVEVDDASKIIYYAASEGGVRVLAADGYPGGVFINNYDVIGNFVPPTGGSFPSQFEIKDISIYLVDNIALATGLGGMYFIQKN